MRKVVIGAGLLFLLPLALMAQEYGPPKAEVFTGVSYLRVNNTNLPGWDAAVNAVINKNLGVVVDASGVYGSNSISSGGISTSVDHHVYSFLVGPRVTDARGRWIPFAQALLGYTRYDATTSASTAGGTFLSAATDNNAFGMSVGGGMDFELNHSIAIRLVDVDYMLIRNNGLKLNGARISAGVVIRLGQKQ